MHFIKLAVNMFFVLFLCYGCSSHPTVHKKLPRDTVPIKGLSMVAPPRPFKGDPTTEIRNVGANWVAIMPFAYTPPKQATVIYNPPNWNQWWGELPEGVSTSIKLAKKSGLKILLKPQVYCPSSWPGAIKFDELEDRKKWEQDYKSYIQPFIEMASDLKVDMFCIGTELDQCVQQNPKFWQDLILEIRQSYHGKLTYAANWDQFQQIPLWKDLDYIGVDAYFPLDASPTPNLKSLIKAWSPIKKRLSEFSKKTGKDIIFTEFGYLSVDGAAGKNWELESQVKKLPINQAAQAIAIEALWTTYKDASWWKGGFLWKWFPEDQGHEGYPERDYTPQGKQAEQVLKEFWKE